MAEAEEKPASPDEDDGRVIAKMNVEGMPWYVEKSPTADGGGEKESMSREQARYFTGGVLKAALLVGGVFAAVYFIFLLFCTQVWFA